MRNPDKREFGQKETKSGRDDPNFRGKSLNKEREMGGNSRLIDREVNSADS